MSSRLRFTEFEIHLIYGFVVYPESPTDPFSSLEKYVDLEPFPLKLEPKVIRAGWVPAYDLNTGARRIFQEEVPGCSGRGTLHYILAGADKVYEDVSVKTAVTTGTWGPGTLTITFSSKKLEDSKDFYTTADILRWMHLIPRTLESSARTKFEPDLRECGSTLIDVADPKSSPELFEGFDKDLKSRWGDFSDPFRILCAWLRKEFGEYWSEFPDFYGEDHWPVEPQIPYFYVTGILEGTQYERAFRYGDGQKEDNRTARRTSYNQEIGAILGRWMEEKNIRYVNPEYYMLHEQINGNAFASQHRDSQVFVTLSPIAALSMSSASEEPPTPSRVTKDSVLRFFEFSRLRWHHMLWTNRKMDAVIDDIMSAERTTARVVPILDKLSRLRHRLIRVLNDPIQHVWNTMVASDLPDLLELKYLDRLEATTIKKLSMIDKLLEDRLQVDRIGDYASFYSRSTVEE